MNDEFSQESLQRGAIHGAARRTAAAVEANTAQVAALRRELKGVCPCPTCGGGLPTVGVEVCKHCGQKLFWKGHFVGKPEDKSSVINKWNTFQREKEKKEKARLKSKQDAAETRNFLIHCVGIGWLVWACIAIAICWRNFLDAPILIISVGLDPFVGWPVGIPLALCGLLTLRKLFVNTIGESLGSSKNKRLAKKYGMVNMNDKEWLEKMNKAKAGRNKTTTTHASTTTRSYDYENSYNDYENSYNDYYNNSHEQDI